MARLFAQAKIAARGNLLPPESIDLYGELLKNELTEERRAMLISRAESALTKDIPFLSASLYRRFYVDGNRAEYETACFTRRGMLMDLAFGEFAERKGRFTEKAADILWAIMEESTWMIPASHPNNSPYGAEFSLPPVFGDDREHGIELFSPVTGALLATVYYLLKEELDAISPVICEKLVYTLRKRLIKPYLHVNFWWMGDTDRKTNNWAPWITSNVLTVAAIILKDSYELTRVVDRSIRNLDNFLKNYAPDGGCDEGPSYWHAAGGALFDALEILYKMSGGRIDLFGNELVRNIGEYMVHVHINNRYFINFADCGTSITPDALMIYRFGERCGSDTLQGFACHIAKTIPASTVSCPFQHIYRTMCNHFTHLPENEDGAVEEYSWMAGNQVLTARSEAARNRGFFLAIKGGTNDESHNHNDIGSFILYKNGEPVIIDAGVGTYTRQTFSADRYKLWNMQSCYHNLPTVGGADQMAGAQYYATVLEVSPEKKTVLYDLTKAYPEESGLLSYTRRAELKDGRLTLTDSVSLTEERETVFHLLTHKEPQVEGQTLLLTEGVRLTLPEGMSVTVEPFETTGFSVPILGSKILYRICIGVTAREGTYRFTFE